jgi:glutamyl-tRNA reductase
MQTDVILVASSASEYVLTQEDLHSVSSQKLIFDLAMPRNVDPTIANEMIQVFCVDDLQEVVHRILSVEELKT